MREVILLKREEYYEEEIDIRTSYRYKETSEIAYFHEFATIQETIAGESGVYAVLEKENGECGLYGLSEFKFKNKAKEGTMA
ncbi:hypothetical protein ABJF43_001552 [Listeria monocytogenes]|uniref:hypothetical protein n=1 Tax=Listeria monocytogenes TaxID=1639 RepID=UPI000A33AA2B|nr:hypothetical protein [Listeria monocytogenes]EAC4276791.1 hypothetical protein [Listeria monocytogenes]EAD4474130.1 hypothetical protein [Listeria monocytogenes]EAD5194846.1 hypothetical protein [Listeria monocytogenes]EAE1263519.1 hypothetical protein [Listeria monocytogenes]EAE3559202.1 hypothetical protein [Listeria monocytogenes]